MDLLRWLYSIVGFDWLGGLRPATLTWLAGGDPYHHSGTLLFVNPPWVLPFLAPLALLPPSVGAWGLNAVTVGSVLALCARYRRPWLSLAVLLSFPVVVLLYHGQIDGVVLLGLALGGPLGLLMVLTKPQVAGFVTVLWLWQAWRVRGLAGVARLAALPALVMLAFTAAYPQWIAHTASAVHHPGAAVYNFWPWLLLPGLLVLVAGLTRQRLALVVAGTTMVSPYLRAHSAAAALTVLAAAYPWLGVPLAALSWWPLIIR